MLWHMLLFDDAFGPAYYALFWCFCIQLCSVQLAAGHGVTAVLLCVVYVVVVVVSHIQRIGCQPEKKLVCVRVCFLLLLSFSF